MYKQNTCEPILSHVRTVQLPKSHLLSRDSTDCLTWYTFPQVSYTLTPPDVCSILHTGRLRRTLSEKNREDKHRMLMGLAIFFGTIHWYLCLLCLYDNVFCLYLSLPYLPNPIFFISPSLICCVPPINFLSCERRISKLRNIHLKPFIFFSLLIFFFILFEN